MSSTLIGGTMNIVDKARQFALRAHFGVANKHDGEPYVLHLDRVFCLVRDAGGDEVQQAVAWLHDTVEDTDVTLQDIRVAFAGHIEAERIVAGVDGMSKRKGETNAEYYWRVKANDDSAFVKSRGDHVDNFGRNHYLDDPEKQLRMAKKYSEGVDILLR